MVQSDSDIVAVTEKSDVNVTFAAKAGVLFATSPFPPAQCQPSMRTSVIKTARSMAAILGVMGSCWVSLAHAQPVGVADAGETHPLVSKHKGVFDEPPKKIPTNKVVDGPILGNGDVGVVKSGAPDAQRFWISKCDFWKAKPGNHQGGAPKVIGGLDLRIPALKGASYRAEQVLYEPEIRSTFRTADGSVEMSSWVAASEDLLVVSLTAKGKAVGVEAKPWVQTGDEATTTRGAAKSVQWITRAYTGADLDWPTGAAVAVRCLDTDGNAFTLHPGRPITIGVAIRTSHDINTYLDDARSRIARLSHGEIESMRTAHVKWWRDFWSKSFIEIPDKLIEKFWYGSLYIMASCSRNDGFPPGLFGNWCTNDSPAWAGDYHLNYNHEAPWWGCYSSNHIELTTPYDAPLLAFMPRGRFYARRDLNCRGIYYPVGIGPKGLETTRNPSGYGYKPRADGGDHGHFLGQKYNAAYGAVNMAMRFYHTYDLEYVRRVYPYLIEVGSFWEDYLKFENGRYVIHEDCLNETKKPDDVNPANCMGMVKMCFQALIEMSTELDVDADRRRKWRHILDHFSEFPTYQYKGKTVFSGAEKGQSANGGDLGWPIIEHIWPAGQIGLDSDPRSLQISRNTIRLKPSWHSNNCVPMTYTAAARVGYDPNLLLGHLRDECRNHGLPNLFLFHGGGGIECASAVPSAINEMLLQSHERVLRFFPVWPNGMDARFGNLRAYGAFLVCSELKDGKVQYVSITSEKGRDCVVQNPWPDTEVAVWRKDKKVAKASGERFTLKTTVGGTFELRPN